MKNTKPNAILPTVAIVTTGGTIAEKKLIIGGGSVPEISGEELIMMVPKLKDIAKIKVFDFFNVDSSQISPEMWLNLSKKINSLVADPNIAGVVVTHGTDTIAEGAYFLDLTTRSHKPIVFTGSMRYESDLSFDGEINLYNAVLEASSPNARDLGVTVTFNNYINSARSVKKAHSHNVQTFVSGDRGYVGYIAGDKIIKFQCLGPKPYFPLPKLLPRVMLLKTFAGDDGCLVKAAIAAEAQGIVIEGFGEGNVPAAVFDVIKQARKKNIVVVVATQVENGFTLPDYGVKGGGVSLVRNGVIIAGDLPGPKARILLMLALSQGKDMEKIKEYFAY